MKKLNLDLLNVKMLHQVRTLIYFLTQKHEVRKYQTENQKLKEKTMRLVAEKTKTNLEFSLSNPIGPGLFQIEKVQIHLIPGNTRYV